MAAPLLKNINFHCKSGKLYGITGKVGSEKSALLAAVLGEIPYYSGQLDISGSVAYVEQESVIFSDTVRNNILFGKELDEEYYSNAARLSCLVSDFKILSDGDQTFVGEKGMSLSGGQEARLSLARALYSAADIYLLDDPISAVDSKVAKELFKIA